MYLLIQTFFSMSTITFTLETITVESPLHIYGKKKKEMCHWFNVFSARVYSDAINSESFRNWLSRETEKALSVSSIPSFASRDVMSTEHKSESSLFHVSVEFEGPPPILSNVEIVCPSNLTSPDTFTFTCTNTNTNTKRDSPPPQTVLAVANVSYSGKLTFNITTTIFSHIPIILNVSLTSLEGTVLFGCRSYESVLSFLDTPKMTFAVHSKVIIIIIYDIYYIVY